jgi:hypothetical protein
MASVLTSAHSPLPRNGTIAPSTLTCWTAGPTGGVGHSRSSRATTAVCTRSYALPAASVRRWMVEAARDALVKKPMRSGSRSQGTHVPSRTAPSTLEGRNAPGHSANSSSRGENSGGKSGISGVGVAG